MTVEAGQRGGVLQLLLHPIAPEFLADLADAIAAKGWTGDDVRVLADRLEDLALLVDARR